ncbi:V-type ATP synthase subunit F [Thermobrachium celere]|uniref:Vacuolar H+-transporting two-sector ATPase, F subunit n=1 Tax=Thermobrachium celere DSM 8682 TaxID=941824 RepID=R7RTM1_9CLOT|nr:V-type ATP synthase subunit F [Thermobrachium celere]GFR34413.1 V-type ATP synthase subunit F [Thermobrachium celere]CDF58580.1 Vacuolar H+-transporting two-sector ATPase, F subunit [Thermobrachium celere DSM 8682]
MNMYLISDNRETLVGLRLAGIKGEIVYKKSEAQNALRRALDNKNIGIIIFTEKAAKLIKDEIIEIKLKRPYPLIVEIPDRHGSDKDNDYILNYVRNSVGIKV